MNQEQAQKLAADLAAAVFNEIEQEGRLIKHRIEAALAEQLILHAAKEKEAPRKTVSGFSRNRAAVWEAMRQKLENTRVVVRKPSNEELLREIWATPGAISFVEPLHPPKPSPHPTAMEVLQKNMETMERIQEAVNQMTGLNRVILLSNPRRPSFYEEFVQAYYTENPIDYRPHTLASGVPGCLRDGACPDCGGAGDEGAGGEDSAAPAPAADEGNIITTRT